MSLSDFLSDCDAFCAAAGRSRVWLSKRLFADTYRLDLLSAGSVDVGVRRLERAASDLAQLASSLSPPSEVAE